MTVLVTGATGYVGGLTAAALREHGGYGDVIALGSAQADLTVPGALDAFPADGITHIVHSAAVTKFSIDRATAQAVNIGGTEQVIEFARRCPDLERLVLVSTLYVTGLETGEIAEEAAADGIEEPDNTAEATDTVRFANYYEWSKHASERLVLESGLPATIARVSTLVADEDTGHVTQYNAVHNTFRLFFYGMLSLMPGHADVPVPVATGEFTAAAMMAVLAAEPGFYQLCPDVEHTPTLGQIMAAMFTAFEKDPSYIRRGLRRPLLVEHDIFLDLLAGLRTMPRGPVLDALESVSPFSAELFKSKTFTNTRLRKAWPGYRAPDPVALVSDTADYLVRTRWGRNA
jgi:nucleoside-diphosphate-sugar epimerase